MVFMDLEKDYDRVLRKVLWNCLDQKINKVPSDYIRAIRDMYEMRVRMIAGDTEDFHIDIGLDQGSTLSPFLLATIMNGLMKDI